MLHDNYKLLSHSTVSLLSCERKFQIAKLRPGFGQLEVEEGDFHLDFGSVVGIGIQEYLITKDVDLAYWKMFQSWTRVIDDDEGERKKKTFWYSLIAIDQFKAFCEQELRRYELVSINGVPATELGFSIDCGDGFYYRGFLDGLLFDSFSPALLPLECKTTGNRTLHEAMYRHSGQGNGYKLIVDAISKILDIPLQDKYKILYTVYQTWAMDWEKFEFTKNSLTLARWIRGLQLQKQSIIQMAEEDFFPWNGNACFGYGQPCKYYGMCEMEDRLLFGENWEKVEPIDMIKDQEKFKFHFKLQDLIEMVLGD